MVSCIITFQAIRVKDERNSWASLEDRTTKVDEALRLFNDLERACMVSSFFLAAKS